MAFSLSPAICKMCLKFISLGFDAEVIVNLVYSIIRVTIPNSKMAYLQEAFQFNYDGFDMGKQPTILFHLLYSNLFYVEAFLAH
jgi:hypothetical protein